MSILVRLEAFSSLYITDDTDLGEDSRPAVLSAKTRSKHWVAFAASESPSLSHNSRRIRCRWAQIMLLTPFTAVRVNKLGRRRLHKSSQHPRYGRAESAPRRYLFYSSSTRCVNILPLLIKPNSFPSLLTQSAAAFLHY